MNELNPLDHVISFLKQTDQLEVGSDLLQAFKKYSNTLEQFDQLGRLFYDVKDYKNSLECTEHALELSRTVAQQYSVRANLAKLYNHTNLPEKSIQCSLENLNINQNDYESKMELLFSYYLNSDFSKSRSILEQLLSDPNTPSDVRGRCEFNQGSYLLDDGNFKEGLVKFIDVGHKIGIWPDDFTIPFAKWNGEQTDKTILIIAEGGIGDEVINVRFAKNVEHMGMKVLFQSNHKDAKDLFERNGFATISSIKEAPIDCLYVKAMYLPIVLDLDKDELWTGPYLKPDPKYVEKWKAILPQGKKVSIKWSGNPRYEQDLHRSVPLDVLNEALDFSRDDITFVSVQKEYFDKILEYPKVFNASQYLETLEDLIACLSLMEYNISSCTSVAHIAAAAGFPITVCPPVATYYTWLGDAKWYGDHCKILRQRKWRDWSHLKTIEV